MAKIRIPLILVLLFASGPLQWNYVNTRFTLSESIPSWLALVALAVVIVLVIGAGRDARHPRALLVVEGVLAFLLAAVPPLVWLGIAAGSGSGLLQTWSRAMGGTSGAAYAQVLAIVWLVTVVRTFRAQRSAR